MSRLDVSLLPATAGGGRQKRGKSFFGAHPVLPMLHSVARGYPYVAPMGLQRALNQLPVCAGNDALASGVIWLGVKLPNAGQQPFNFAFILRIFTGIRFTENIFLELHLVEELGGVDSTNQRPDLAEGENHAAYH